mmetsp:Transcript_36403/g.59320  ORF Transcript_36403/g.59320 Transcript_36403/m.59320 type:complete len:224 (-) Transcript_36403:993-1664(-)
MAHTQDPTFELPQGQRQSIDCVYIRMVGGLIQDQQVRVLPCQYSETDSHQLAARQGFHGRKSTAASDTKPAETAPSLLVRSAGKSLAQILRGRDLAVLIPELLHVVPRHGGNAQAVVTGFGARQQLEISSQGLEQGALARPVVPDNGHPAAAGNLQIDVVQHTIVRIPTTGLRDGKHHILGTGCCRSAEGSAKQNFSVFSRDWAVSTDLSKPAPVVYFPPPSL